MTREKILVVDDEPSIRKSLDMMLSMHGYQVGISADGKEALQVIDRDKPDLILADVNMPRMDGIELLKKTSEIDENIGVILITGYGSIDDAVSAMRLGAHDYITKPINDDEILTQIDRYFESKKLRLENQNLKRELKSRYRFENIIGADSKMQKIYDLIETVADTPATVTILGENGTGKSMLARAIHYNSSRAKRPFIEVSCGTLTETLLESELFGHSKGAFTGATRDKPGKFEQADDGTIFLDEIGSSSPAMQLKLLRVLQERTFERVGGEDTISVDIRVITASNTDLRQQVKDGEFREDLYYRLNIVQIHLPPLRERLSDVKLLAEHFLGNCSAKYDKKLKGVTRETLDCLQHYHWPGNVRELENCMERAVLMAREEIVQPNDLPPIIASGDDGHNLDIAAMSLTEALQMTEKQLITKALEHNNWNRNLTASRLHINRTTLFKKMRKYGLFHDGE
jgi:DNA-binding NtrC family response regulator